MNRQINSTIISIRAKTETALCILKTTITHHCFIPQDMSSINRTNTLGRQKSPQKSCAQYSHQQWSQSHYINNSNLSPSSTINNTRSAQAVGNSAERRAWYDVEAPVKIKSPKPTIISKNALSLLALGFGYIKIKKATRTGSMHRESEPAIHIASNLPAAVTPSASPALSTSIQDPHDPKELHPTRLPRSLLLI
ncbi:hypothetical protein EDD11_000373 [Mortierella claussenii]|nr:hypothetical protein EDD11_000373 [Mortierella claussenii]